MEPAPGTIVTQNVRLVRELGQGGMGSVWVADHLTLETQVAVKFISVSALESQPDTLPRFEREAKAAARIKSPHVVHTYDQGVMVDGTPYIVMELLHGESLAARLKRADTVSIAEAEQIVSQAAKGLGAAHKQGVVHRDVKPENIFLTLADDEIFVKLLDFGIAKRIDIGTADSKGLTATNVVIGTPQYMSPEQLISARTVDARADLWALAVVAYRMLTGRPAFAGETLIALCLDIASGSFAPPSTLDVGLDPAFDEWFARALACDPEQRFESSRELAASFSRTCRLVLGQAPDELPRTEEPPTEPADHLPDDAPVAPDGRSVSRTLRAVTEDAAGHVPARTEAHSSDGVAPIFEAATTTAATTLAEVTGSPRKAWARRSVGAGAVLVVLVGASLAMARWLARSDEQRAARSGRTASSVPAQSVLPTAMRSSAPVAPGSALPTKTVVAGMVGVAAGKYWLGCVTDRNRDCFDDEKPGQQVELKSFAIMSHEVTAEAYDRCVAAGGCPPAGTGDGCSSGKKGMGHHPINCVSWHAASAFCAHHGWRLPSEAQWEVAALGRQHPDFPWGNTPPTCDNAAIASAQGPGCGTGRPRGVGTTAADKSWVDAFDMAGNVCEWTDSDYEAYPGGQKIDRATGRKVSRGGSYEMNPTGADADQFTCHTRYVDPPETTRPSLGFRCAMAW